MFIESQIPLDKVSELVCHSYLLRQPTPGLSKEWRHFRDQGVVSKECLKSFPRHYVPDVFSVDNLVEYLKERFVFAPVTKPVTSQSMVTTNAQLSSVATYQQSTSNKPPEISTSSDLQKSTIASDHTTTGDKLSSSTTTDKLFSSTSSDQEQEETHYIMPTLWKTLSEEDIESRRISSPVAATLLVRFPKGFRRAGVFCCLVVHLIHSCGWDLVLESKEPLYRNCIKLRLLTSPPLTIVLIDSNSHIEVHVNASTAFLVSDYTGLLPIIKRAIPSSIFSACRALNYLQTKPHFTFYCPHIQASLSTYDHDVPKPKVQHTATLTHDRKYWRCDIDPDAYFGPLEDRHKIWFGIPQGSYYAKFYIFLCLTRSLFFFCVYNIATAAESELGATNIPSTLKKSSISISLGEFSVIILTIVIAYYYK